MNMKMCGTKENIQSISHFKNNLETVGNSHLGYFIINPRDNSMKLTKHALQFLPFKENTFPNFTHFFTCMERTDVAAAQKNFSIVLTGKEQESCFSFRVHPDNNMPVWVFCTIRNICSLGAPYIVGILQNVTDETNYKLIVESCLDGTFVGNLKNDIAVFSGKIFDDMMLSEGVHPNATAVYSNIVYEEDKKLHQNYIRHIEKNKLEHNRLEYRVYDVNRNPMWISNRNRLFFDENDQPSMVVGGYININRMHSYHSYMETMTEMDDITGLPNRFRMFKDWNRMAKKGTELGYVVFVNVDNFSNINNIFDYSIGNQFLKHIANILQNNAPPNSILYHCEADNFALVMPDNTSQQAIEQMEHYISITGTPFTYGSIYYPYTISTVGVAYSKNSIAPEVILKKSTIAMKKLKMDGKERYLLFKKHLFHEYNQKIELETRLRECVANNMRNFFLVYQPFIDAKKDYCIGAEALLRWRNQDGTIVSPTVFIPILENIGLMDTVGEWVFKEASTQCKKWLENRFQSDFYVSVNVTTPQLSNNHFSQTILQHLQNIQLPTKNIVIEITESVLMLDFQRGMKQLKRLKKHGIRLAIDDFGTGYSSLSYLKKLPVDEIKIDRSFIQDIEHDSYSREFVASIIKITQSIGRIICLEGIENTNQMELLKEMKSDVFQGFLFSKPLEPWELEHNFFSFSPIQMAF